MRFAIAMVSLTITMSSNYVGAENLELLDGKLEGAIDTTLSYGAMWRVQGQDASIEQVNLNDGNRNFETGLVSSVYKVTTDLDLSWSDVELFDSFGVFIRGNAFYDSRIMDQHNDSLSGDGNSAFNGAGIYRQDDWDSQVKTLAGSDARILDAFIYAGFEFYELPVNIRIGEQVINWGEGLFLQDSINTINPADISKLRLPGSELREALTPEGAFYIQIGLTDNLNMEAYYQYEWHESELDGVGTYFSTNDVFGRGGHRAITDVSAGAAISALVADPMNVSIGSRIRNNEARHGGQWGVSFRYIAEELNDTEFGFYFVNYHSRKPTAAYATGDDFGCSTLSGTQLFANTTNGVNGVGTFTTTNDATDTYAAGCSAFHTNYGALVLGTAALDGLAGVLGGVPLDTATGPGFANLPQAQRDSLSALALSLELNSATNTVQEVLDGAAALASINQGAGATFNELIYLETQQLQQAYAEDIRMYGISFNTSVGDTSLGGEISFRPNMPITTDPITNVLGLSGSQSLAEVLTGGGLGNGDSAQLSLLDPDTLYFANSGLIQLWDRKDIINGSFVAITSYGPLLGFDQSSSVFEVGFSHVGGLGSRDKFRDAAGAVQSIQHPEFDGPATSIDPFDNAGEFISSTSWGYRAVLTGRWNDVYAGINLTPTLRYSEDVNGNSYRGGNFIEGRKSATVSLSAIYLNNTEASISYSEFWDAGQNNPIRDRDNLAVNFKYSF